MVIVISFQYLKENNTVIRLFVPKIRTKVGDYASFLRCCLPLFDLERLLLSAIARNIITQTKMKRRLPFSGFDFTCDAPLIIRVFTLLDLTI